MLTKYVNFRRTIILFTSLFFVGGCNATDSSEHLLLDEKVDNFIIHLLARDEEYIVKNYLDSSPTFSNNGRLTKAVASFLYESDSSIGKKSIQDVTSKREFSKKIIWQNKQTFTVIVTDKGDFNNLSNLTFLESEWMKKYFACEFVVKDDSILLYQNVCFAETGGPFPRDYDF